MLLLLSDTPCHPLVEEAEENVQNGHNTTKSSAPSPLANPAKAEAKSLTPVPPFCSSACVAAFDDGKMKGRPESASSVPSLSPRVSNFPRRKTTAFKTCEELESAISDLREKKKADLEASREKIRRAQEEGERRRRRTEELEAELCRLRAEKAEKKKRRRRRSQDEKAPSGGQCSSTSELPPQSEPKAQAEEAQQQQHEPQHLTTMLRRFSMSLSSFGGVGPTGGPFFSSFPQTGRIRRFSLAANAGSFGVPTESLPESPALIKLRREKERRTSERRMVLQNRITAMEVLTDVIKMQEENMDNIKRDCVAVKSILERKRIEFGTEKYDLVMRLIALMKSAREKEMNVRFALLA